MNRTLQTLAVLAVTLAVSRAPAGAQPSGLEVDPEAVPWSRLQYQAKKLFMKGTTDVALVHVANEELARQLIESPEDVAIEPGDATSMLGLATAFAGRRSETKLWFHPREASALQRFKIRHGKNAYSKTYRYTQGGVFARRRAPQGDEEAALPAERWSGGFDTFYPHPEGSADCGTISEPAAILYLASAAAIDQPLEICSFSSKVLSRVTLRPAGSETLAVDYSRSGAGSQGRRKGKIETRRLTLEARPVEAGVEGDFEFLGLEGDIEIFLDERVPVEVRGKISGVGSVAVKLVAADLR